MNITRCHSIQDTFSYSQHGERKKKRKNESKKTKMQSTQGNMEKTGAYEHWQFIQVCQCKTPLLETGV